MDYTIEFFYRPGYTWTDQQIQDYVARFREVSYKSFCGRIPDYQCLVATREALQDKVIVLARNNTDGSLLGFTSAVLYRVPGLTHSANPVIHIGLTCVLPEARHLGLVRKFTTHLLLRYCVLYSSFWRVHYITNLASVVSVLGQFAEAFDDVYPSPLHSARSRSRDKNLITRYFVKNYTTVTTMQPQAVFNQDTNVFEGANYGTALKKQRGANRHRDPGIDAYFTEALDFDRGDAMLQVASFSLFYFAVVRPFYLLLSVLSSR